MVQYDVFQRGETITLRIGVSEGTVADVVALPTAQLKPLSPGQYGPPGDDVAALATFVVTAADADSDGPLGYTLTLPASVTALLPAGRYITDVRCSLGTGVYITEAVTFPLVEAVS